MRRYPIQGSQVRVRVPHPYPESIHMSSSARIGLKVPGAMRRLGTLIRWR